MYFLRDVRESCTYKKNNGIHHLAHNGYIIFLHEMCFSIFLQ